MKKAKNVVDLAGRLTNAATAPLLHVAPVAEIKEVQAKPRQPAKVKRRGVSVFLRLSPELFARMDAEAVARTKAKGRGVTVQQVIIDKLEGSR